MPQLARAGEHRQTMPSLISDATAAAVTELLRRPEPARAGGAPAVTVAVRVVECGTLLGSSPRPHYNATVQWLAGLSGPTDATGAADGVILAELAGGTLTPGREYLAFLSGTASDGRPIFWCSEVGGAPNYLAPVRVATTTAGTLSTSFANGQFIDGVTLVTGDAILIKDQSLLSENGTYIVNASGAPNRRETTGAQFYGALIPVTNGTTNGDSLWQCTNDTVPTVGSTAIQWARVGGVSGSGVTNRVAYWSGTSTLASSAGFTYDPGTGALDTPGNITTPGDVSCFVLNASIVVVDGGYVTVVQHVAAGTYVSAPILRALDSNWGYGLIGSASGVGDDNKRYIEVRSGGTTALSKSGTLGPGAVATGGIITNIGSGSFVGTADDNDFTGENSFADATTFNGTLTSTSAATFTPGSAATVPSTIQGAASQSANLSEWKNSSGTLLAAHDSAGVYRGPADFGEWTSPPPPPPPPPSPPPPPPPLPPPP